MDAISDPQVDSIVMMSSAQVGKALALDTPIATAEGWTTMADIRVGDTVFDDQGQPCRVTFVSPIMDWRPCYRVVFSDGSTIVADADHLWTVDSDTVVPDSHGPDKDPTRDADHAPDRRDTQVRPGET